MPLITNTDLYSRLYEEIVTEITREDESLGSRAIDAAIEEAKMYLSKFDLTALFGTDTLQPTVTSTFLKNICVDIAVWHLVKLGNANIRYDPAKAEYEMARAKLKDIQAGKAQPDGWPYRDTTGETAPQGDSVTASSNTKRSNHF